METCTPSITLPISYTFTTSTSNSSSSTSMNTNYNSNPNIINGSNPWMDTRIWSRLPQRIVDRVIAFLPPPAFFRARTVCKRWYALLFSNSFLQLYLQLSPPRSRHWFLFFNQQKGLKNSIYTTNNSNSSSDNNKNREAFLFDPYEVSWYRLSLSFIPLGFSPASSSGGLICWVSEEAGFKNILLSNPLIVGSITPLPSTLRTRLFPSVGLTVTASSIDLAVAGDDLISPYAVKNITTESFHIDGGGYYSIWGTTSNLPRLCSLESGKMIFVGGKFYCMNYSPFSVLAHDVSANNWCKIQAPMRRFLRSPSLVESRGRLILIAAVEKSKLNVPKSLRLWGLQGCGMSWVEIERMPQQLYFQFEEVEGGRGFDCVAHGEFIIISARGSDKLALLFDFCRKRWLWIPPCPFVHHHANYVNGEGGGELHGFAYEPRLATPVTGLLDHLTHPFHQSFNG